MRRPRPPSLRGLLVLVLCLAVLAAGVLGGVGVYYSNQLLNVSHAPDPYPLRVSASTRGTVTLPRNMSTLRPGTYGLAWADGAAVLGAVAASGPTTVTRRLTGPRPVVGTMARLETGVWSGDPLQARRLPFTDVTFASPLGPMPAWYVAGSKRTWVITAHGYGASRLEPLRILPTLHALGLPILDISYRNDVGAPREVDHLYHLGDREWRDIEAAVKYASGHGARRVVLYGWSMGGALVEAFLQRSTSAARVSAVVLDAPVLDWRATLAQQSDNRGLPSIVPAVAEQIVHWRIGIRWSDFDLDDHPSLVAKPTLLFHGGQDTSVPIEPARRLAAASKRVTFVEVPAAGHTQSWNVDPAGYSRRVTAFLTPYAK